MVALVLLYNMGGNTTYIISYIITSLPPYFLVRGCFAIFLTNILNYFDTNLGNGIKEILKTYWFVIGMLFGAVLYLIEQKFKK